MNQIFKVKIFAKCFCELTAYLLKIIYLTVSLSQCSQEGLLFLKQKGNKKQKNHCFLIISDKKKGSCEFLQPLNC